MERDMDMATGDRFLKQGNVPAALEAYGAALAAIAESFQTNNDATLLIEFAMIGDKMGQIYSQQGNFPAALDIYEKCLAALDCVARAVEGRQDLPIAGLLCHLFSSTHQAVGDILNAQGNSAAAIERYRIALGFKEREAATSPADPDRQNELAFCHFNLGDAVSAQGDGGAALDSYRSCLAILDRLEANGASSASPRLLVHVLFQIAAIEESQNGISASLKSLERVQQVLAALVAGEADNVEFRHNLALCHERIGDLKRKLGDPQSAFENYGASAAMLEQVAATAEEPATFHRMEHVVRNKMGDLLREHGGLPAALDHYRQALALVSAIAATDIGNTGWQRDLWQTHNRIGDTLLAQGQYDGALDSYGQSHIIFKRLALSDPENDSWQRDLLASYVKLGELLHELRRRTEASGMFGEGRELANQLIATSPDNELWKRYLTFFDEALARPAQS
jgi:tetratricopeptide (TPR) repeat protein